MQSLFQAVYSGILYGSVYGLMAIGLTLIWGSLRMLNLAHGSLYLSGAYIAFALVNWKVVHLPLLVSFGLAVVGAGAVGFLIQFLMVDRILGKPGWDTASLIVTVGASIMVQSAALLIFGAQRKLMPTLVEGQFRIGTVLINNHRLLIIGLAVVSLIALSLFLRRTRYGLAIQAVSQHMDAARLMGIPVRSTFWIVMFISAALAGLAGVLLSSVFELSPTAGYNPMARALVVTIFGGLGSVKGTIWAAFIIGLLESFLQVYAGAGWALPGLFGFMIVMLIIRPNGLFGLGEMQRL
jgi:branched-chain amino acid transport system permease protein